MNDFETNDKKSVEFEANSSFSAKAAEQSKNDYEKVLENLRQKKTNFESVNFVDNKKNQEDTRKSMREAADALDQFYDKMGMQIEGLNKFNDAEQKIMDDAKLAYEKAQQEVATTKAKVEELAAMPTGGFINFFKNKVFANLEAQKAKAKLAYENAVANEVFCKNDIPAAEIRAKRALETRREQMTIEQFSYEFIEKTNVILGTLQNRLTDTDKSKQKLFKLSEEYADKLIQLGKDKLQLEEEKTKIASELTDLNTKLADIPDTTSSEYIKVHNSINATKVKQTENLGAIDTVIASIAQHQTYALTTTAQHESMIDQYKTLNIFIAQLKAQVKERLKTIETMVLSMKNADTIEGSSNQGATNNMLDRISSINIFENGIQALHTTKKVFVDTKEHGDDMREIITNVSTVARGLTDDLEEYKDKYFTPEKKEKQ